MRFTLIILLIFFISLGDTLICTNGYTKVNNKCWKLFYDLTPEQQADEVCRVNGGGILATLKTAIDNRGLLTVLNNTGVTRVWIGLQCTGLSPSTCQWADKTSVGYSSFSSGFPNDRFGQCVYYSSDGYPASQWANGPCNEPLAFVCELPLSTPDYYNCTINYNNYCYTPDNETLSFSWAQKDCVSNGANLVSIHSFLENRFITSLYNTEGSVWLGGLAPGSGLIVWSDGSRNDYYNLRNAWNGTCVSMDLHMDSSNGNWTSIDCGSELPYLCKRPTCSANGVCP